jgi:hypothetical protein
MALSLPDDVNAAVFDLADALGTPATKVVTDLLQEMVPQLQGLAKVARASKAGNKAAAKRALQHMMGDAMAEVLTAQQPDMFASKKATKKKAASK